MSAVFSNKQADIQIAEFKAVDIYWEAQVLVRDKLIKEVGSAGKNSAYRR